MKEILTHFVHSYILAGKTFGMDLESCQLKTKDLSSESLVIFEISYFGHASGFFRVAVDIESLQTYNAIFETDYSNEKAISLFKELMNQSLSSTVAHFEEFKHSTIGLPRQFYSPVSENKLLIEEASILDKNINSYMSVFLYHDYRKTDISKELEKQQKETQMASMKAQKIENEYQLLGAQKFEAIGQLAAGVAHEINTPIQFVSDNVNFLSDSFNKLLLNLNKLENLDIEYYKQEIPAALSESKEGLERIANIVKSLKEFSHSGNDKIQLYPIKKLIETCISLTRNEWKYVAKINSEIEDLKVRIYPNELSQVFINMIINSSQSIEEKFGKDLNGMISLKFYKDNDDYVFVVEDNGTGIPECNIEKVFNPFFTTKEIGKGTGQGLAISKKIIKEKHNGDIQILKNSPDGLCFKVTIRERDLDG